MQHICQLYYFSGFEVKAENSGFLKSYWGLGYLSNGCSIYYSETRTPHGNCFSSHHRQNYDERQHFWYKGVSQKTVEEHGFQLQPKVCFVTWPSNCQQSLFVFYQLINRARETRAPKYLRYSRLEDSVAETRSLISRLIKWWPRALARCQVITELYPLTWRARISSFNAFSSFPAHSAASVCFAWNGNDFVTKWCEKQNSTRAGQYDTDLAASL